MPKITEAQVQTAKRNYYSLPYREWYNEMFFGGMRKQFGFDGWHDYPLPFPVCYEVPEDVYNYIMALNSPHFYALMKARQCIK